MLNQNVALSRPLNVLPASWFGNPIFLNWHNFRENNIILYLSSHSRIRQFGEHCVIKGKAASGGDDGGGIGQKQ